MTDSSRAVGPVSLTAFSSCGVRLIDLARGVWQADGLNGDSQPYHNRLTRLLPRTVSENYVIHFKWF
jgi:hypothetical protein